ncbi:hypothetical protein [Rhodovulum euryhalinum]|uniref:Uncharacterized protein n=1 Tax=Rhodovulum euryhalinum TaxID=35805 RepID=A0A4R2KHX2_9RHOB|nr:hypothetical protein [Rhodovulum euryhalinum]TCO70119.1 hypothetical protein EV655_11161 [Rhodovulum euryhalinum]
MTFVLWPPAGERTEAEGLVARPFGTGMADLMVDFERPTGSVIGAILQLCLSTPQGEGIAGAEIAAWTLAKRRQGLLAVAVATNGPVRSITTQCSNPACDERLDLEIDLTAFRQDWRVKAVPFEAGRLRLPCPVDLADLGDSAPERLAHILFEGPPPKRGGWEAEAEAALAEADPLGDLELSGACPGCGGDIAEPLVLETFLVTELAREAGRLMDEIHVLALAYNWTEPDIMALPAGRRRHYIARIREAWAA